MKARLFVFVVFLSVFMIGCASMLPRTISETKDAWIYIVEADMFSDFEEGRLYYCLSREEKLPVCYEATVEKKPEKKSIEKKKNQVIDEIEAEDDEE